MINKLGSKGRQKGLICQLLTKTTVKLLKRPSGQDVSGHELYVVTNTRWSIFQESVSFFLNFQEPQGRFLVRNHI
jgi:hypothetical protein